MLSSAKDGYTPGPGDTPMFIHYESGLGAVIVPLFVITGATMIFIVAAVQLAEENYLLAAKPLTVCIAWVAAYLIALVSVYLLSLQAPVIVRDSYCADIWCIEINRVNTTRRVSDPARAVISPVGH